ncbi:hypothetical protein PCANB_002971 [Pneumocystis canis]|nr:hypothetical protein PCK1_003165 [Pneumocystis canis]KAG5438120.1 hypothetical protein PCANB_002971 [Pneumocystis canis]
MKTNIFLRKKDIFGTNKGSQRLIQLNRAIQKHPFLLFGIPFITIILSGAYVLSIPQQLRYKCRDQKITQVLEEQTLGLKKNPRKINIKDEYYRLQINEMQFDNWEPVRVKRLPDESENILASNYSENKSF